MSVDRDLTKRIQQTLDRVSAAEEWFDRPTPGAVRRPSMESLLEAIAERGNYPTAFRVREEAPSKPTFAARAQPRWRNRP